MTVIAKTPDLSRFCSVCAQRVGLDPIANAYSYVHVLAVEIPLPWPESMYYEPGVQPQELLDIRQLMSEAYERGEELGIGTLAIAPDPEYSQPGYRRVISYKRPTAPYASFAQEEYLVPEDAAGALCWALLVDREQAERFAAYRQPSGKTRDLMVCTHGAIDAACAKFGFPLYRYLRRKAQQLAVQTTEQLRVWRVCHFGGHVFAPTLLDLPDFHYWAYVDNNVADLIAQRSLEMERLRNYYRGWAGFDSEWLQVAERDLFALHGWPWVEYLKSGRILEQNQPSGDSEPTSATVQIDYVTPDGSATGSYIAQIEQVAPIECKYSTSSDETYPYPQYAVVQLERIR